MKARLLAVRVPIAWSAFGFPSPFTADGTLVVDGPAAWAWAPAAPEFGVAGFEAPSAADDVPRWAVDHVVLMVPEIEAAVAVLEGAGANLRLRVTVRDRPTAFFRVGTLLEVIETSVPSPRLYGVALVTDEPLDDVAARWRAAGHNIADPRPAIQEGRHILTVRDSGAGLAVMSPEVAKGA